MSAALDVPYATRKVDALSPIIEAMFTTEPLDLVSRQLWRNLLQFFRIPIHDGDTPTLLGEESQTWRMYTSNKTAAVAGSKSLCSTHATRSAV